MRNVNDNSILHMDRNYYSEEYINKQNGNSL